MSDSEDTAQLLGSKSYNRKSLTLNTNHVKPEENRSSKYSNWFLLNGRKHIFEAFSPIQSYVGTSVAVLAGLSFGFDMTVGTNILLSLGSILDLNCFEHKMLVNGWIVGAIIAAVFGGIIIDKCGRRSTMLGSSLVLSLTSLLGATSGSYLIPFVPRFLSGCSVCSLLMSQSVYIAETSRSETRSKTIVTQQIGLQVGILLSAIVGLQNATNQSNHFFHMITGMICAFGMAIFFITYIFLPESPHYIISRETKSNVLDQHYGSGESHCSGDLCWSLARALGLVLLIQGCGRSWVLFYAPRVFAMTGICFSIADGTTALTTAIIRILSAIILLYTVGRLGVRASILTSLSIMSVSMISLSIIAGLDQIYSRVITPGPRVCNVLPIYTSIGMLPLAENTELKLTEFPAFEGNSSPPLFPLLPTPVALHQLEGNNPLRCVPEELLPPSAIPPALRMAGVITLLTSEAGYTLGFGSLGWLATCEILPTSWRARGLGLSVGLYLSIDLLVQMTFLKIKIPIYCLFILFSVVNVCTFIICYIALPDTRNKSLTEIQTTVNARNGAWLGKLAKLVLRQEGNVERQTHI